MSVSRRSVLRIGITSAGALVAGPLLTACDAPEKNTTPARGSFSNGNLMIDADNQLTVFLDRPELGQGVSQGLLALIAISFNWDVEKLVLKPIELGSEAPADFVAKYIGGSFSFRSLWSSVHQMAQVVNGAFVAAALNQSGQSADQLRISNGIIAGAGFQATYSDLVPQALQQLRTETSDKLAELGGRFRRQNLTVDYHPGLQDKVSGRYDFAADREQPSLYAMLLQLPQGGRSYTLNNKAALLDSIDGLEAVEELSEGIALVGRHTWAVLQAESQVDVTWEGDLPGESAESFAARARDRLRNASPDWKSGSDDFPDDANTSGSVLEAEYHVPFLSHAQIEPFSCYVNYDGSGCHVVGPTQSPRGAVKYLARTLGIDESLVALEVTPSGGSFGRRATQDYYTVAGLLAYAVRKPLRVIWSRKAEMQYGFYRPAALARLRCKKSSSGENAFFVSQQLVTAGNLNDEYPITAGRYLKDRAQSMLKPSGDFRANPQDYKGNRIQAEGGQQPVYGFSGHEFAFYHQASPLPSGYWRSVGFGINTFFLESFIDEMAQAENRDPATFRLALLEGVPRARQVIETALELSQWSRPADDNVARGLALCVAYESFCAHVVEVQRLPETAGTTTSGSNTSKPFDIKRITCVADCGTTVNPDNVRAQLEGATLMGLSAALGEAIGMNNGWVSATNFNEYSILRQSEVPVVKVQLLRTDHSPGGVGELALPGVAPALANALARLGMERPRRLPVFAEQ
ncbi:MAG: molybdopterin cofactor-binding domain-containing protein [Ketobacteraceae bacterium]|nr:molybdopterin cofactor-binding domain-containing protein [Ketobacteraceae bacterium]